MTQRKSWEEFKKNGLLWWINQLLHLFGWAIVLKIENDKVVDAYPARVKFRGFSEKDNTEGYIKVSQYMKDNAEDLFNESKED